MVGVALCSPQSLRSTFPGKGGSNQRPGPGVNCRCRTRPPATQYRPRRNELLIGGGEVKQPGARRQGPRAALSPESRPSTVNVSEAAPRSMCREKLLTAQFPPVSRVEGSTSNNLAKWEGGSSTRHGRFPAGHAFQIQRWISFVRAPRKASMQRHALVEECGCTQGIGVTYRPCMRGSSHEAISRLRVPRGGDGLHWHGISFPADCILAVHVCRWVGGTGAGPRFRSCPSLDFRSGTL